MSVISFLCLDCIGEFSFYLCGFWGDTDKLRLCVFNLNPLPVFTRTRYFIMAQIIPPYLCGTHRQVLWGDAAIPLLGGDSAIPLLGGVRGGFLSPFPAFARTCFTRTRDVKSQFTPLDIVL